MTTPTLPPLDELGLFVAVVEAGGFTAAARSLGWQKATLSRRVRDLEEQLGARLLHRTTRAVHLTELGTAYYEHASRVVSEARRAASIVRQASGEPAGVLRLSATQLVVELMLGPTLVAYLAAHPKVTVDIDISSHLVDAPAGAFDVVIRSGTPPEAGAGVTLLGWGRDGYYASPSYLRARGAPRTPRALETHDAVVIASAPGPVTWPFARGGRRVRVAPPARLRTPSYALAREAAVGGLGVTRLPAFYAEGNVRRGALAPVLESWTPPETALFALVPGGEAVAPKVRAFLALLGEHFKLRPSPTLGPPETRPRPKRPGAG
ncbi:MAG TPA: LysR substrate-binding domain-containing protein [Polyangiaceae bacterium]|nr:LysR substrate-binding domain-containing protein [Polyangiaceae bacterium]